jgi:glutathione synthase
MRVALETEANVILVRQDPPYDMTYLTTTWLLSMLKKPKVYNSPKALRERPEKLFPLHFPEFCPPTLISANVQDLLAFQREVGAVVLKPLYGHGGHGVFKIPASGENLDALLEMLFRQTQEPVVLQQFLPFVTQEEKRILLINGEFAGAFGRIPAEQEIRSNIRIGGVPVPTTLSPRQYEICEALKPFCKKEGLMLVGLDVIGDWMTEINITSPTGLRAVENLYNETPAALFWDAVEG